MLSLTFVPGDGGALRHAAGSRSARTSCAAAKRLYVPLLRQAALPGAEMERWVLATYPAAQRDILLSGWVNGLDRLEKRAAAVATTFGKGRLVLLGFRPQHRAQTPATFPFVFNALYWSTAGKAAPARP